MDGTDAYSRSSRFWFCLFSLSLVIATIAFGARFDMVANDAAMVATYSHGVVRLTIPYDAAPGTGNLTAEILDPEDHVLGRARQAAEVGDKKGRWHEEVKLNK